MVGEKDPPVLSVGLLAALFPLVLLPSQHTKQAIENEGEDKQAQHLRKGKAHVECLPTSDDDLCINPTILRPPSHIHTYVCRVYVVGVIRTPNTYTHACISLRLLGVFIGSLFLVWT